MMKISALKPLEKNPFKLKKREGLTLPPLRWQRKFANTV